MRNNRKRSGQLNSNGWFKELLMILKKYNHLNKFSWHICKLLYDCYEVFFLNLFLRAKHNKLY